MKLQKGHMLDATLQHVGTTFGSCATCTRMLCFEVCSAEDLLKKIVVIDLKI